jgi:N-acylneuraminate cytidylyltransferase
MIHKEKILALIPARGGSKGIKNKNIRLLAGKPLIGWTIESALKSAFIDRLIVSTDSQEIADIAIEYGAEVPFLRGANLAQDDTKTIDVVLDVLKHYPNYEWLLLLQPTSPLRSTEDIDDAIRFCIKNQASSCVSVCLSQESPYWTYILNKEQHIIPFCDSEPFFQRQQVPKTYRINGAIYFEKVERLLNEKNFVENKPLGFLMPQERSVDIDNLIDFQLAELLIQNSLG